MERSTVFQKTDLGPDVFAYSFYMSGERNILKEWIHVFC